MINTTICLIVKFILLLNLKKQRLFDVIFQTRLLQMINNILMHAFVRDGRWNNTYASASCSDVLQLLSRC